MYFIHTYPAQVDTVQVISVVQSHKNGTEVDMVQFSKHKQVTS